METNIKIYGSSTFYTVLNLIWVQSAGRRGAARRVDETESKLKCISFVVQGRKRKPYAQCPVCTLTRSGGSGGNNRILRIHSISTLRVRTATRNRSSKKSRGVRRVRGSAGAVSNSGDGDLLIALLIDLGPIE